MNFPEGLTEWDYDVIWSSFDSGPLLTIGYSGSRHPGLLAHLLNTVIPPGFISHPAPIKGPSALIQQAHTTPRVWDGINTFFGSPWPLILIFISLSCVYNRRGPFERVKIQYT